MNTKSLLSAQDTKSRLKRQYDARGASAPCARKDGNAEDNFKTREMAD